MSENNDQHDNRIDLLQKDIELFHYLLSHDLTAPLRRIHEYHEDHLQQAYASLPETVQKGISVIERETQLLQKKIELLQEYIGISVITTPLKVIDCNIAIEQAVEACKPLIEKTQAILEIPPLPAAMGRSKQVLRLFTVMLENALTFADIVPHITLAVQRDGTKWKFTLTDNGIGIMEDYHDIIFYLFQKTPEHHAGQGLGAGLGIAKKIIDSYEEKIWVESTPGKGSAFYFTLQSLT